MSRLEISPDLSLPHEAVTQTFAILAKRGVGKTYTALVIVEEMHKANLRVVVADPVGVCWGLRASADGKGAGLAIPVFGGEHGDVPLESTAGTVIADLIVDEDLSAVLDLSLLRKGEQTRFMQDFAERLYHRNRKPLHLVLDEADAFAPQRPMPGQQRMLGAVEDLVRRGRARGIGLTLVTQRAAVLNKDVLTQVEVMVALRTIAPQDRAAIDEWIKVHGTPEQRSELMQSLPSLPIGTAWFWSPGWLDEFKRVRVRQRETFDSSATPKVGMKANAPKKLAEVDLESLRERIAATIETAKNNDPRELKKRIADLEREVRARPVKADETAIERAVQNALKTHEAAWRTDEEKLRSALADLQTRHSELRHRLARIAEQASVADDPEAVEVSPARTPLPRSTQKSAPVTRLPTTPDITAPQQRILDALASFENLGIADVAKSNVAVFSDQSPRSSGFTNNLGRLRTSGLIDYPSSGRVALTDAGRTAAAPAFSIRSVEELHDAWCAKLPAPRVRILRALIKRYPNAVEKGLLASDADQSVTSSGYTNNLGALRSLGLIDYPQPGSVVATDLLFPIGLA